MKELGRLMAEAHASYSGDFEGSCVEADAMVALAQDLPGLIARGSRRRFRRLHGQPCGAEPRAAFAEALGPVTLPRLASSGDPHLSCIQRRAPD